MNILVFTEYFPASEHADVTGGVEARAIGLLKEVAKRHTVTVVCSYQGKPQRRLDRIHGINILRVGMKSPYSNKGNIIPRLTYAFMAFVTGLLIPKVEVIDGFSYLNYLVAASVGGIKHKPVVLTYHESWSFREWTKLKGWFTGTLGAIWTWLARQAPAKRYIAVSNATKETLVKQGIKASKISVVYNGIDIAHVNSITARQGKEPSVVVSARLIKTKRIDVLIRAVAMVKKELSNVQLTILGDGPEKEKLEKLIAKLKLERNVAIRNVQKFDEQLRIMKRHKVFCLPSELEGFGMAIVAGMAAGLPVVCTDLPVLREVTDGSALLFPRGKHKELAKQLLSLFSSQKLYEQKRKESLKRAQVFDWPKLAKQAENVYRRVT